MIKSLSQKQKTVLCNSCLGRMYGQLSTRLTNKRRGELVSEFIESSFHMDKEKLSEDELLFVDTVQDKIVTDFPFSPTFESKNCDLCEGVFEKICDYVTPIMDKITQYEFSNFRCGCSLPKKWLKKEEEIVLVNNLKSNERPQKHFNRVLGRTLEPTIGKKAEFNSPDLEILINVKKNHIKITSRSIFIAGRYRKFIRTIPQTRWPCRLCKGKGCEDCNFTGQQYLTSIEAKITSIPLKAVKGKNAKLHGAGREDIDALMLGSGRPFVMELQEPLIRTINLDAIKDEINTENKGIVEVSPLFLTARRLISEIKTSAPESTKKYRALIETEYEITQDALNKLDRFFESMVDIAQRTPQRVSHRRADLIRKKEVYSVHSLKISDNAFEAVIHASGGTYIKELISSDDGRTSPSFTKILLNECICIELDVIEVNSLIFDQASIK
ncbi:MAG: tRNA pseudouridine(54/55) synthase Pus10 [Candidatus Kariarchaeaceae archaeon]